MVRTTARNSHLGNTGIAALILAVALALVGFVGLGDAYRNYPSFIADKLNAQGQIVKNSLDTFLAAGLPLEQFSGFPRLTVPLIETDPDIERIDVQTPDEAIVFAESKPDAAAADRAVYAVSRFQPEDNHYELKESDKFYKVILPLENKFEQAGRLQVFMRKSAIEWRVRWHFLVVGGLAAVVLVVFAAIASRAYSRIESGDSSQAIEIAYTSGYVIVAIAVVIALTLLYSSGLQAKTRAITQSLTSRLEAPLELGIQLTDLDGIEATFNEYQQLNPEISYIALKVGDEIAIETTANDRDAIETNNNHYFVYEAQLNTSKNGAAKLQTIAIKSPRSLLYYRLWRSVKNFLALFVASGFIAIIFLNLLRSLTRRTVPGSEEAEEQQLRRIEPFYFLGAFIDGLSISFLPQYLRSLAVSSGADASLVSTQFTVFFFGWAIAMIPAANLVKRRDVKPILLAVGALTVLVSLGMAFVTNFYLMYAVRALAGATQGLLLVAVQSYVLEVASARRKTQAGAMMVFDFFGGRLASTAIGALLSVYVGIQGVFGIAIAIAMLALWYCWKFLPQRTARLPEATAPTPSRQPLTANTTPVSRGFLHDCLAVARDFQFVKALLLIGLPYRAIFTGVTVFALPLLLAQQDYQAEDIGQIIMFYAAGVLVASTYISRWVDRVGRVDLVLCLGCAASGVGLILIGSLAWLNPSRIDIPGFATILVILGVTITGAGHGSINAPSLTYITETRVADKIGKSTAGSLYRLIERAGQIAGPILVGQLLAIANQSPIAISWIGLASVAFGLLFLVGLQQRSRPV